MSTEAGATAAPANTLAGTSPHAPSLDYAVLDVFAEHALEGNPLAVFSDARGLTDTHMQAIARETNLSETTFLFPHDAATEDREGVRVRIFTTQEELPFAGHPTLGTATWLFLHHSSLRGSPAIHLACNAGRIPVHFTPGQSDTPGVFATMRQNDPEFRETLSAGTVADALGLVPGDLDPTIPPQIVSTGNPFCVVVLRSLAALARLRASPELTRKHLAPLGARWFYCIAPAGNAQPAAPQFRARMQFNGSEDPATGSAAGCAIALLVQHSRVASGEAATIAQGIEIHRPSRIVVSATLDSGRVSEVRVGGRTIPVASGRLFLP